MYDYGQGKGSGGRCAGGGVVDTVVMLYSVLW